MKKIIIDTQSLDKTIRGIGYYTKTLLQATCHHEVHSLKIKSTRLPFSSSIQSLFKRFKGADLIHFPEPKILYGVKPKIPFILTIHDLMPLLFPHFFPKKSSFLMRNFLPRYLNDSAAIVTVSNQTKKDLLHFFPHLSEKVYTIPCALLPAKRTPTKNKDPFLLYIGSFEPRKNLSGIFKAFSILKQKGLPHKLIIVGKEEGKNKLPKALPPDTVLKGYISEKEKQSLLEKASLLFFPSFYEGFGLPLLEAMASGTPIITSNCSATKEIAQKAALLIDPNSPEEIASAAFEILSSKEKTTALMEKGFQRSQDFSLEKMRQNLDRVYSKVLESHFS